jgi:hypothetical protein
MSHGWKFHKYLIMTFYWDVCTIPHENSLYSSIDAFLDKHLWNFQPWHIIRIGIQTFNMIFKIISIYNNNTSRFMLKYFSIFFCNITRVAWGQAWTQKGAVQKASVDVNISVSLQRSHVIDHFVWYFLERIYIGMSCYPMQFIYWITYSLKYKNNIINHIKFLYSNSDYVSWLKISQMFKDWSQFVFGSWRNNLNQVVHNGLRKGMYNLIEFISNEPNK